MTEKEFPKPEMKKVQVDTLADLLSNAENIAALHGRKLSEIFVNEESTRSFIDGLDETDFIELLNSINGIIRGADKNDWTMAKGSVPITLGGQEGYGLPAYTPPNAKDREMLFTEVLHAMKEMTKTERSLEDTAILLSSSVNAIHAYPDANGRTSRLLYLLLTKGLNKESESAIKRALSEEGRDIVDVNPEKIEKELQNAMVKRANFKRPIGPWEREKERKDIAFDESLPHELRSELIEMLADVSYSSIALHQYLNDRSDAEKYLKYYPSRETKWGGKLRTLPEQNNVLVEGLFKDLDEAQAREILSIYRQTKIEMIHTLIDSIIHPDETDYTDTNGTTILERFRQMIKRDSKIE